MAYHAARRDHGWSRLKADAKANHPMQPDDELCLCFHVTKRKVVNFIRVEKPKRVAQLSECFGAGTGCGWCRPFLQRLFDEAVQGGQTQADLPGAEEYARLRAKYVRAGGGTPPPGAAPLPEGGDGGDEARASQ
jgi:NAD(P)H-nitrite reductase large subunit